MIWYYWSSGQAPGSSCLWWGGGARWKPGRGDVSGSGSTRISTASTRARPFSVRPGSVPPAVGTWRAAHVRFEGPCEMRLVVETELERESAQ